MHLAAALENAHPFFAGDHRIAIKVSGALLELSEILDRFQRALGAEEPLNVHATETGGVDAMAEFLRTDVADEMGGGGGVAIGMAVKTANATRRPHRTAVVGVVELLLHKRRHE